jgi:hypothetical protein
MTITFSNIRNVKSLPETPTAYVCNLTISKGEETWDAIYCARAGGGGICDAVIAAIEAGDFEGVILPYEG